LVVNVPLVVALVTDVHGSQADVPTQNV